MPEALDSITSTSETKQMMQGARKQSPKVILQLQQNNQKDFKYIVEIYLGVLWKLEQTKLKISEWKETIQSRS